MDRGKLLLPQVVGKLRLIAYAWSTPASNDLDVRNLPALRCEAAAELRLGALIPNSAMS
jgi:hypothetical protein